MKGIIITLASLLFLSFQIHAQTITEHIKIDQFGYLPDATKIAVISNPQTGYNSTDSYTAGSTYEVRKVSDDLSVYTGTTTTWNTGATHVQSGDKVWWFDFSSVIIEGEYYLYDVANNTRSYSFRIANDVYADVLKQAVRVFFYQRSGFAKTGAFAGVWADGASHLGTLQDLESRSVTSQGDASTAKDLSGGWFDAGDYNKYVNFAYQPMHSLLFAYQENPSIWGDDYNIPESGNGVPDILDEIRWQLDWLLKMQLADGSVLMKISVTDFSAASPPSADTAPRYYGESQASSTRTTASMFAHASMVFRPFDVAYADLLLARAELAWSWISANPAVSTYSNTGFSSANPEISADEQNEALTGAAAMLFAATGNTIYRDYFDANYANIRSISWWYWYPFNPVPQDLAIFYANLPNATPAVSTAILNNFSTSMLSNNAAAFTAYQNNTDAYRGYLADNEYVWGSNRVKSIMGSLYMSMISSNLDASNHDNFKAAAAGYLHNIHGVNPMGITMLTNMSAYGAENSANEMYHNWFGNGTDFDNALTSLFGPPPGYVTGGVNPNFSPDAAYSGPALTPPMNQPIQKSYKDWNTSWPENSWEVTEPSMTYQGAYVRLLSNFVRASTPLPIDLLSFKAKSLSCSVILSWTTANEENNDFFEIESSLDGIHFETLGKINGKNTLTGEYEFIVEKVKDDHYYRLVQVDFNGAKTVSEVVFVVADCSKKLNGIESIYPNPIRDGRLNINTFSDVKMDADIVLWNVVGQEVLREKVVLVKGNNTLNLAIKSLNTGIYFVFSEGENWTSEVFKVVVY